MGQNLQKFRVNKQVFRTLFIGNPQPVGLEIDQVEQSRPLGHAFKKGRHGEFMDAICDELGRQYVVATDLESREFSERAVIRSTVPVVWGFIGRYFLSDCLYGFNTYSAVLYVQLWQTITSHPWETTPTPSQLNALNTMITQFPVQPGGTFSLDVPVLARKGLSIAISSSHANFTQAPAGGAYLMFTAHGRVRETTVVGSSD